MLDDLLDYPFTLISAPAGYGKTTLMIDLAAQADYPTCWYCLDTLDQDPHRFLAHLFSSIQRQFPQFGKLTFSLLENLTDPYKNLDQMVGTLVNDIYENITEHFVIFVDDFHLIKDNPQIGSFISHFGQAMDENTHLVISSRELFDLPDLPLLIGRIMVKGLCFEDLAFQGEEIKALFENKKQLQLTDQEIHQLTGETKGWITGLLLSMDVVSERFPNQARAVQVTGTNLFYYLAQESFISLPDNLQGFLLNTAIFDEFNCDLYCRVFKDCPPKDCADLISLLVQQNLFIQQIDDERSWFRFHQLFLDFLRLTFHKINPEEEKLLLNRLNNVYAQDSAWEKAYDAAQRLGNPKITAELINQASSPLFHSGRINLLASWLNKLPSSGFEEFPKLFLLQGIANSTTGSSQLGLSQLTKSIDYKAINKNPILLSRGLLCRATTYRLLGAYKEALDDIYTVQILIEKNKITSINNNKGEEYNEAIQLA